jgi:mono/diheme cytochrome c family protein
MPMHGLRLAAVLLASGIADALAQQPAALAAGDPDAGKRMVEKDCDGCHVRRFGDTEAAYSRIDRRVNTPEQLLAQIAYCNTELGTGYFPDDEVHIAAYLNRKYYRFKP